MRRFGIYMSKTNKFGFLYTGNEKSVLVVSEDHKTVRVGERTEQMWRWSNFEYKGGFSEYIKLLK